MPDPIASDTRQRLYSAPPHNTACEVIPGRRKGDTKWVLIYRESDGFEKAVAFLSEDEAHAKASHAALPRDVPDETLTPTDVLLHNPVWRL